MSDHGNGDGAPTAAAEPALALVDTVPESTEVSPPQPGRRGSRLGAVLRAPLTLLRFILRRLLWLIIRLIRGIWRHPVATLLLVVAIYAGYRGYQEFLVTPEPPPPAPEFDIAPAIPPAESVVRYLAAQHDFDADGMWATYSETAKAANLQQGSSLETLRRVTETIRSQGIKYGDSAYVGGYKTDGNRSFYFYVTTLEDPIGEKLQIYQVFYVDTDGTILRVIAPELF